MCEVNDRGCDGEACVQEDDALEKIFSECDASSTGRVSVTKLIGYMRDHMSPDHGSPEILKDLRKSMRTAASYDGKVTRKQYYDVSRLWLAKVRKRQHYQENHQDGNNNLHVGHNSDSFTDEPTAYGRPGSTSRIRPQLVLAEAVEDTRDDAAARSASESAATNHQGFLDSSTSTAVVDTAERCETPDPFFGDLSSVDGSCHVANDHAIVETAQDLRQRAQRYAYDNDLLREELQRAEDSIATQEKELAVVTRKLELANRRYERLQGEHEEQRELLVAAERDRDALAARNHRLERDNSLFRKEIDAAETEIRRLNADLGQANEQREERIRLLARCRQELIERKTLYDEARGQILQMELANNQLREKHDVSTSTTEHLKVIVKELETRISELQPNQNYILHGNALLASPPSENGLDEEMEIFQESPKMLPCSLRDEMKATGYGGPELNRIVEIRYLNDTTEGQNTNSEYVDAIRWATEKLERGTAEFAASRGKMLIGSPPAQSLFQVTGAEDRFSSTEDLRGFGTQIRHVLAILSLMASGKVTNADTKDATTQLDLLDLVPEPPAVCNIEPGITSYANNNNNNNNNNNKFCPTCKRVNRSRKEGEEALVVDEDPGIISARSTSPFVPPFDLSSTPCSLIACSTPRTSPRRNPSRVLSPEYFQERAIIDPVVAALDDIIQGTSSSSSECDATYSPVSSRRGHNARYIYTLPPSRRSESKDDVLCGAESSLSTMPIGASNALSRLPGTIMTDGPEFVCGSESMYGGEIRPQSYAWRCRDTKTTDDTSDDTYGKGSNESQSLALEERNCRSSTVDLSGSIGMSSQSVEGGDFVRTERNSTASPEMPLAELDPAAPVHNKTFTRCRTREHHTPDIVEGLKLDLEKLTLRAGMSDDKDGVVHTNSHREVKIINASDRYPAETVSAAGHRPHGTHRTHGKVPKRKSSVYQRSFDYYSRLEMGQKTAAGHHHTEDDAEPGRLDEYPREDSSKRHPFGLGVLGIPTRPSLVKPTKSEISLGNHRAKYVVSGTRTFPPSTSTPTLTLCLPPNDEMSGDVASERCSDGREIPDISRSVARAMSSDEDSSDSECARDRLDRGENVQVVVLPLPPPPPPPRPSPPLPQTKIQPPPVSTSLTPPQQQQASLQQLPTNEIRSAYLLDEPLPRRPYRDNDERITGESDDDCQRWSKTNQRIRRSLSESDSGPCCGNAGYKSKCGCSCGLNETRNRTICGQGAVDAVGDPKDRQQSLGVFPNLPDARLIELGLAGPSDGFDLCERMGEDELERKYTALSIGLGTDRVTLPRRLALSLRQRDQAECNLGTEVERMQRDIQALAPLCVDRESVERVERVRHQLEMISRCTLRVSCTAELLGATHQERRVSRAALLADRYLQALRARCDKIVAELAETKRILAENNIVVEENPSELTDDVAPRVRYRGVPSTNRTTMSRRRASIATISRPASVNPLQDPTKDNARQQRTPVSARMSLRRPSLGYDTQRWDNEKLDRTDSSSSSIGELREIFEQAESRRGSREENNNLIRSQSSNFSVGSCESGDSDVWASTREDAVGFLAQTRNEELPNENRLLSRRTPRVLRTMQERVSRLPISWYILFVAIFFFGFYSNRYVSTRSAAPFKWWSIDEILRRYAHVQRNMPPPT